MSKAPNCKMVLMKELLDLEENANMLLKQAVDTNGFIPYDVIWVNTYQGLHEVATYLGLTGNDIEIYTCLSDSVVRLEAVSAFLNLALKSPLTPEVSNLITYLKMGVVLLGTSQYAKGDFRENFMNFIPMIVDLCVYNEYFSREEYERCRVTYMEKGIPVEHHLTPEWVLNSVVEEYATFQMTLRNKENISESKEEVYPRYLGVLEKVAELLDISIPVDKALLIPKLQQCVSKAGYTTMYASHVQGIHRFESNLRDQHIVTLDKNDYMFGASLLTALITLIKIQFGIPVDRLQEIYKNHKIGFVPSRR